MTKELYSYRKDYKREHINPMEMLPDPFDQFSTWFQEAASDGIEEPNAMILATVGNNHRPSARIVLLKESDGKGFIFYTNYQSKKAKQIDDNPYGALLFPWHTIHRQVRIEGNIERLTEAASDKYFQTRPAGSQIGAWVSQQSKEIAIQEELDKQAEILKNNYRNKEIPRPPYWGGFRLVPDLFEFWQGRENRLHDRFEYFLSGNEWRIRRRAP
jgi:pyridoxamine 5'-phosphate oxidase